VNELDRLYARIPKLECKRLCQQSCGPIVMNRLEWERIKERRKGLPMFASAENRQTLTCPYLDETHGSCSVYAARPLICRLWGVVKRMRCPWGCAPAKWMSDKQARRLLRAVQRLSGGPELSLDMELWNGVKSVDVKG